MTEQNKIKYGLKNVHYAVQNEVGGVITYETPVKIPGAVNMTNAPVGDAVEFYADDGVYFSEKTNNGYDGNLEIALIPDTFRVDVLGDTIDTNGALLENANAKPKKIALMFEFDGDAKQTRHILYSVAVARPNLDGSTRTNTKEPQTDSMSYQARPRMDNGNIKAKLQQGKDGYDTFFTAVYEPNAPINTVAYDTETFSKAAPADIEIEVTSTDLTNTATNVMIDGVNIPGINLTVAGTDVIIADDYVGSLDNGIYTITVEFKKGNAVTVTLTVGK